MAPAADPAPDSKSHDESDTDSDSGPDSSPSQNTSHRSAAAATSGSEPASRPDSGGSAASAESSFSSSGGSDVSLIARCGSPESHRQRSPSPPPPGNPAREVFLWGEAPGSPEMTQQEHDRDTGLLLPLPNGAHEPLETEANMEDNSTESEDESESSLP